LSKIGLCILVGIGKAGLSAFNTGLAKAKLVEFSFFAFAHLQSALAISKTYEKQGQEIVV